MESCLANYVIISDLPFLGFVVFAVFQKDLLLFASAVFGIE
jgi:hypothetical protein